MAILNITAGRSDKTVIPSPVGSFSISTINGNRCIALQRYQSVDNTGYFNSTSPDHTEPMVGDVIYADSLKTILYNTTGAIRDYNINNRLFISLDAASRVILNHCR